MKIRKGFVSNSSSSSFIVIGNESAIEIPNKELFFHDGYYSIGNAGCGCYQFGWQDEMYCNVFDRINFAYIQAYYMKENGKDEYMQMLEEVLIEKLNLDYIQWDFEHMKSYDFYIDHQSASYEGENIEMFANKEELIKFLFSNNSYIQCGNDNG